MGVVLRRCMLQRLSKNFSVCIILYLAFENSCTLDFELDQSALLCRTEGRYKCRKVYDVLIIATNFCLSLLYCCGYY